MNLTAQTNSNLTLNGPEMGSGLKLCSLVKQCSSKSCLCQHGADDISAEPMMPAAAWSARGSARIGVLARGRFDEPMMSAGKPL